MVKKRGCGHHCPVCGSSALPLQGFSEWREGGRIEGDVPWRFKLGRIAHKCQDGKHRFDVDINTNQGLPEYLYKIETGGPIKNAPAGAPREYPVKAGGTI
jgi:hypothetical protein